MVTFTPIVLSILILFYPKTPFVEQISDLYTPPLRKKVEEVVGIAYMLDSSATPAAKI